MTMTTTHPTMLASALASIYGFSIPRPMTRLRMQPCAICLGERRMTLCRACNGAGRVTSTEIEGVRNLNMAAMQAVPRENHEPIGEWMRSKGFPPESSLLLLPESYRSEFGNFPPRYVRFSALASAPMLTHNLFGSGLWV